MFRCLAQLQSRQTPQPQGTSGNSNSGVSSSSARSRRRRSSNSKANSVEPSTKGLLKRPVHQPPTRRPHPLPPDPGAGSAPQQQQRQAQAQQQLKQAALQHQRQQTAQMGTVSKLMGGLRSSQDELVDYLIDSRLVKSSRVADALRAVDRGKYVNHAYASRTDAYQVCACRHQQVGVARELCVCSVGSMR